VPEVTLKPLKPALPKVEIPKVEIPRVQPPSQGRRRNRQAKPQRSIGPRPIR